MEAIERTQPPYGGAVEDSQAAVCAPPRLDENRVGWRLVGTDGPYAGRSFALANGVSEIGRDPDLEIELPDDPTVSRSHARIVREDGIHVLYDAESTNGCYVNGARVTRCPLAPGDVLQCAGSRFRYE